MKQWPINMPKALRGTEQCQRAPQYKLFLSADAHPHKVVDRVGAGLIGGPVGAGAGQIGGTLGVALEGRGCLHHQWNPPSVKAPRTPLLARRLK